MDFRMDCERCTVSYGRGNKTTELAIEGADVKEVAEQIGFSDLLAVIGKEVAMEYFDIKEAHPEHL